MVRDFAISVRKRNLKRHAQSFFKGNLFKPTNFVLALVVVFILFPLISIFWVTRDLPSPNNITKNAQYSSSVLDRKNKVIYQIYDDRNIIPVSLSEVPLTLRQATIAIEDKSFYQHKGFSLWGIFRSMVKNVVFRRIEGGGSTLTQQLIKNSLLSTEQTFMRKAKELILAVELERRYSKDEILEMYLNQTPYGGTSWGVESAAQYYFGKHVSKLNLAQSALLAGLPQSPSRYSPYIGETDAYVGRTAEVLRRMREDKYITREAEEKALKEVDNLTFDTKRASFPAPHFIFYLKDLLDKNLSNNSLYQKGLIIKSTLDLELQREIEVIVADEIAKTKSLDISNAAVVVIDPKTGEILSMVGSVDFNNEKFGKFNAALGLRQPGSTLKPFTYALALQNGYTASTPIMDVPTEFTSGQPTDKPYQPVNYDGKYHGPVQLRMALGSSLNVPAVKILSRVGIRNLLETLYQTGLTTLAPTDANLNRFGLSLTLGGGEVRLLDLVSGYTAFANRGESITPKSIIEVRNYQNKLIYKPPSPKKEQVFTPEVSFVISHILSDNNARLLGFGSNNYLNIGGYTVAAKTGTTDDKRDNWTIGYTKDLVVGVWVGNNDNSPMNKNLASGISGAAPIWRRIFLSAFKLGYKDGFNDKPEKVKALEIDALFGGLPKDGQPTRSEYFVEGTEPKSVSSYYRKLKISKSTGKLANETEIGNGNYDEKEFFVVNEEDPLSTDGRNRFQEAIDKWASEQGDDRWKPSRERSDSNVEEVALLVNEPKDNTRINSNDLRIYVKASSEFDLRYFEVLANDESKIKTTEKVIDQNIHLSDGVYRLLIRVENDKGKSTDRVLTIGINTDPNPTPTLTPTVAPSPTSGE